MNFTVHKLYNNKAMTKKFRASIIFAIFYIPDITLGQKITIYKNSTLTGNYDKKFNVIERDPEKTQILEFSPMEFKIDRI